MRVDATGSSAQMMYQSQNTSLTDEQKTQLNEILSKYDSSSMTQEDMMALGEELRESGIRPSREVMQIMEEAGFEPPPPPPMGPPPMDMPAEETSTGSSDSLSSLQSLLEQLESGDLSEEEFDTEIENLKQSVLDSIGSVIDSYL